MALSGNPRHGDRPNEVAPSTIATGDPQSVVTISDDDGQSSLPGSATASRASVKSVSRVMPDVATGGDGTDDDQRTKRAAVGDLKGAVAKKAKIDGSTSSKCEEETTQDQGENSEAMRELEERLKARANEKIAGVLRRVDEGRVANGELRLDLTAAHVKIEALEASRDEERAKCRYYEEKEAAQVGDKKSNGKKQNGWQDKAWKKIRDEMQEEFGANLEEKIVLMEKRLSSKHARVEKNLTSKLQDRAEKLRVALDKIRELKEDHKEQVKELRTDIKEAKEFGGPSGKQKLKDSQEAFKAQQKQLDEANTEIDALKKELIHAEAMTNVEKTQKDDMTRTHQRACKHITKVEDLAKQWKAQCNTAIQGANIAKQNQDKHYQLMQAKYKHEYDELDKKWRLQVSNSAESQRRVVQAQRLVLVLNHTNKRLVGEVEQHRREYEKLAVKNRKNEHEKETFRTKLAQLDVSPLDVLDLGNRDYSEHSGQEKDFTDYAADAEPPFG